MKVGPLALCSQLLLVPLCVCPMLEAACFTCSSSHDTEGWTVPEAANLATGYVSAPNTRCTWRCVGGSQNNSLGCECKFRTTCVCAGGSQNQKHMMCRHCVPSKNHLGPQMGFVLGSTPRSQLGVMLDPVPAHSKVGCICGHLP